MDTQASLGGESVDVGEQEHDNDEQYIAGKLPSTYQAPLF